jgi:hypothetical protein
MTDKKGAVTTAPLPFSRRNCNGPLFCADTYLDTVFLKTIRPYLVIFHTHARRRRYSRLQELLSVVKNGFTVQIK